MMKVLPVRKARLNDRDFHEVSVSLIQTKKGKKNGTMTNRRYRFCFLDLKYPISPVGRQSTRKRKERSATSSLQHHHLQNGQLQKLAEDGAGRHGRGGCGGIGSNG